MAMMKCPECGKQVSTKALTCPHCGAPISVNEDDEKLIGDAKKINKEYIKDRKAYRVGEIIGSIVFIIIGIVLFVLGSDFGDIAITIGGVVCLIIGVIGIIYNAVRLKNL